MKLPSWKTLWNKKKLNWEFLADFHFSVIEKNLFNDNENSYFFFHLISFINFKWNKTDRKIFSENFKIYAPKNRI